MDCLNPFKWLSRFTSVDSAAEIRRGMSKEDIHFAYRKIREAAYVQHKRSVTLYLKDNTVKHLRNLGYKVVPIDRYHIISW